MFFCYIYFPGNRRPSINGKWITLNALLVIFFKKWKRIPLFTIPSSIALWPYHNIASLFPFPKNPFWIWYRPRRSCRSPSHYPEQGLPVPYMSWSDTRTLLLVSGTDAICQSHHGQSEAHLSDTWFRYSDNLCALSAYTYLAQRYQSFFIPYRALLPSSVDDTAYWSYRDGMPSLLKR